MKKFLLLSVMSVLSISSVCLLSGCNTYDVIYFNKDGTPYARVKASLTDIGKITESTKNKSWVKWHNGVIVLGEVTISSESNGVPCFKGMFGDYDDGIAFFVEDQKDFEGMAKVVAAARRNATTAKMDSSGMNVSNEKENSKNLKAPAKGAPVVHSTDMVIPPLPGMPVVSAEPPVLPTADKSAPSDKSASPK